MGRKFQYVCAAIFLLLCLILALRPLDDYDIFMQIALGRAALESSIPLSFEPFLASIDVAHYANPGWLWQVFAALLDRGSLLFFQLVHVALFALAFILVLSSARQKTVHGLFEALTLAILPALSSTSIRPQVIAFFFFALTFFLLRTRELTLRLSLLLTFCFVIWQNCHPSALLALPLIALVDNQPGLFSTFSRDRIQLAALCILSAFLTPEGLNILSLSEHNYLISKELFRVTEWMSYFELPLSFLPAFGGCAALASILIFVSRQSLKIKSVILYVLFTGLSLYSVRFVVFWSLIALPLTYTALQQSRFHWLPFDALMKIPLKFVFQMLILIYASLLSIIIKTPLLSPKIPVDCIAKMGETALQHRVFNDLDWGGYIAYAHGQQFKLTADGRLYLRDKKWWQAYLNRLYGKSDLQSILESHNPDIFILSSKRSRSLAARLLSSPEWENTYMSMSDEGCTIFTYQGAVEEEAILSVSDTESINSSASATDSVSTSLIRSSEAPAK